MPKGVYLREPAYEPTPAEIRRATAKIRATWDAVEEKQRAGHIDKPPLPPLIDARRWLHDVAAAKSS